MFALTDFEEDGTKFSLRARSEKDITRVSGTLSTGSIPVGRASSARNSASPPSRNVLSVELLNHGGTGSGLLCNPLLNSPRSNATVMNVWRVLWNGRGRIPIVGFALTSGLRSIVRRAQRRRAER